MMLLLSLLCTSLLIRTELGKIHNGGGCIILVKGKKLIFILTLSFEGRRTKNKCSFDPIPFGLFLSIYPVGWGGGLVSRDIMHKQYCNSHVNRPTF